MRCCISVGLIISALLVMPQAAMTKPRAVFVASYEWAIPTPGFGGFSGLDIRRDGVSFLALSDSGTTMAGKLTRGSNGGVTAVSAGSIIKLRDETGERVKDPLDDSEGLAFAPNGGFFVSFELLDRIAWYKDQNSRAMPLEPLPNVDRMVYNAGPEALAVDVAGAVYTLPEQAWEKGPLPVFRFFKEEWRQPFGLRQNDSWSVVGADFGPDGHLYLLERDYWGLIGFKTRVRRVTLAEAGVLAEEVLLETRAGQHDNLEGLAVWQDKGGAIRLTMISDDNFLRTQRTEFVDYRIEE
ncbi:MAG: esterase-like activity of phytase family protein [Paracoccaceae bacterium]|nr:esterase-like activity of phytase family protein [Paracoccaceae bacterium]